MGRNARIGLFLLMGLIVALARLIEVEVGKARPAEEPTTALLVRPPRQASHPHEKKTHRASPLEHARHAKSAPPPAAPREDAEGLEWPKGPVYTVKKGETLGVIAQKVLGTAKLANKLYEANASRITNRDFVKPGTRLIVPSREGARGE